MTASNNMAKSAKLGAKQQFTRDRHIFAGSWLRLNSDHRLSTGCRTLPRKSNEIVGNFQTQVAIY